MRSRALVGFCLVMGLAACSKGTSDMQVYQADLSPTNETPPHSTAATGVAGITYDSTTGIFRYSIEVENINNIVAAHIHVGAAGVAGPVRVPLFATTTTTSAVTATEKRVLVEGTFTAANITGGLTVNDLLNAMQSGNAYVNVHTTSFPGGEMRGQVRVLNVS
jgi:hypothetical protein